MLSLTRKKSPSSSRRMHHPFFGRESGPVRDAWDTLNEAWITPLSERIALPESPPPRESSNTTEDVGGPCRYLRNQPHVEK